jgi:hypothetical protein
MNGDTLVFPQLLSMFPSGLPGIALLRASWPIVVSVPSGDNATFLLVAALMAGVASSDRAFESRARAIH